jgi:hypothetical protein
MLWMKKKKEQPKRKTVTRQPYVDERNIESVTFVGGRTIRAGVGRIVRDWDAYSGYLWIARDRVLEHHSGEVVSIIYRNTKMVTEEEIIAS